MYLCRECFYYLYTSEPTPCPCCGSQRLSIPCSENLAVVLEKLIERGIEVVSGSCDTYNTYGSTQVQVQIELGQLYSLFNELPPEWCTYTYYSIIEYGKVGSPYTGLSHSSSIPYGVDDEVEFATMITISNLELWLDSLDNDGVKAVLRLDGYSVDQ